MPRGGWLLLAGLGIVLGVFSYWYIYTTFGYYDDTGDWLIGLSYWAHHGGLYTTTYSQCGPFYYECWWLIYTVTGLAINPNDGYLMSLLAWTLTATLFGVAVWRFTGRLALGVLALIATQLLCENFGAEVMEPAHLSYALVAVVLVIVSGWARAPARGRMLSMVGCGALCAAVIFTKVNIGVLVTCGVLFAAAAYWPDQRVRRLIRPLASVLLVILPLALMSSGLHGALLSSFYRLGILAELSVISLVAVGSTAVVDRLAFTTREARAWLAGAVGMAAVVIIVIVLDGTPPGKVISGALTGQAGLAKLFDVAPEVLVGTLVMGGISTGCAICIGIARRRGAGASLDRIVFSSVAAVLRLAAGVWILLTSVPPGGVLNLGTFIEPGRFAWGMPLAWIVVLGAGRTETVHSRFVRTVVATVGVLGCLEVFPVAGSQLAWASLLLVPVAVLLMWDGVQILGANQQRPGMSAAWAVVALVLTITIVGRTWPDLRAGVLNYDRWVSFNVPAGQRIRQQRVLATPVHETAAFLRRHCPTFVSSPGLNSFYFFTDETPPTGLNTTQWRRLLSAAQQDRIVAALRSNPRMCVLESAGLNGFWYSPAFPAPLPSPLLRYIQHNYTNVVSYGMYSVAERNKPS